jgi:hypothetical protein
MYLKYQSHPVYKLKGFKEPVFLQFAQRMRSTKYLTARYNFVVPGEIRNEIERVAVDSICGPLQQQFAMATAMQLQLNRMEARLEDTLQRLASAPANVATPAAGATTFKSHWPPAANEGPNFDKFDDFFNDNNPNNQNLNQKGQQRKRVPKRKVGETLPIWSSQLKTAEKYWLQQLVNVSAL